MLNIFSTFLTPVFYVLPYKYQFLNQTAFIFPDLNSVAHRDISFLTRNLDEYDHCFKKIF